MQCDLCPNEAAFALTEVVGGKGVTRHFCHSCGNGALPLMHTNSSVPVSKIGAQLGSCARCNAPTAVILTSDEQYVPSESGMKYRCTSLPLCPACADTLKIKYPIPPADHVTIIHHQ